MLFDSLEKRSLLSAALSSAGVLTVTGTAGNDVVDISLNRNGEIVVVENVRPDRPGTPPSTAAASSRPARPTPTVTKFAAASVKSILVNAGEGNDLVKVGPTARQGQTQLNAVLNGEAGNDHLLAGGGNDLVNGGDGDDLIVGGPGSDTLNGDAGDDRIDALDRGGIDTIDGGTHNGSASGRGDVAIVEEVDLVSNVEKIIKKPRPTPPATT